MQSVIRWLFVLSVVGLVVFVSLVVGVAALAIAAVLFPALWILSKRQNGRVYTVRRKSSKEKEEDGRVIDVEYTEIKHKDND